mgnify:CR=1 FL=1
MFESLSVNEGFRNQIETAFNKGRLSHALIFEGASEEIRLKAAIELSKAVLCKEKLKPCGVCSSCIKAENLGHPDLHLIRKPSDSTMIKVDTVREIKSKALLFPNEGSKSIFIINEAQLMNPSAQNALLKIFEEPQSHVLFILTCPSKSSLLDTVISRATAYSLGEEFTKDDSEKAQKAKDKANELLLSFAKENELLFMKKTAELQKDKHFLLDVLKQMSVIVRDCVVFQSGSKEALSEFPDTAKALSTALTAKKGIRLFETVSELIDCAEKSANHNLTLTRLSSKLYDIKNR